jgi:hypothetical protein
MACSLFKTKQKQACHRFSCYLATERATIFQVAFTYRPHIRPAVWQRIHEAARNMSFLDAHNPFAVHVLDRLISGLRAKIGTHIANNYYSHALLCKEAWNEAKKSAKASKGSGLISADEISKHLLPQLIKKFPHTVGNNSSARSFLLSFFSSKAEHLSQSSVCQAVQCLHVAKGNADQQKKGYEPNLSIFADRLAAYPDRLQNIYFTWLFLLRALKKAEPKLRDYDFTCGTPEETMQTKSLVLQLLRHVQQDDAAKEAFQMLRAEKNYFTMTARGRSFWELLGRIFILYRRTLTASLATRAGSKPKSR